MPLTITQLISYPIKSCAGIKHTTTTIDAMGLKGDRQLMLVDENGLFMSQRKYPQMALIQVEYLGHVLNIKAPGMETLTVDSHLDTAHQLNVTIWKNSLSADSPSLAANHWFSDFLKKPVSLVKYGQHSHRLIDPSFAKNNETVAFADGYPLLIAHETTLEQLNLSLEKPVGMDRFRPNIVVSSPLCAWEELSWDSLVADKLKIDLVKPCSRCVITGVDQNNGIQTGTEVLMTLKQQFAHQDKAVFGINGIANTDRPIELSIGQTLKLN